MFRKNLTHWCLSFTIIATTGFGLVHAEFYRWVDDEGTIHYSDSLPPSKSQRQQEVLNEQGQTVETISGPKTLEQLEQEEQRTKIEAQERELKEQAERRDRVLLAMYLSVEDIEEVRDERLATVQSAIDITTLRKKKFIAELQKLDASEQRLKSNGLELQPWIITSRAHYQEQLTNVNEILAIKETEKLAIKKRFASDIDRYLELRQPGLAVH